MRNSILRRNSATVYYIIFGLITTALNLLIFWIFNLILGEDFYLLSNVIAWILAAIFAYFVNKIFVFQSKSWAVKV